MQTETHKVTYKGVTRLCHVDTFELTCEALIKEFGAGEIPKVEPIAVPAPVVQSPAVVAAPVTATVTDPAISESGKARAQADELLAREGGFSPAAPIYSIGTRVNSMGVENARKEQVEHAQKPFAIDAARDLVAQVRREDRQDLLPIETGSLRMDKTGRLVVGDPATPPTERYPLTARAFGSVFSRFPCASGVSYLRSCPEKLRAINFNHWATEVQRLEALDENRGKNLTVLRTRKGETGREVFAAVTPSYTAFDADKIGQALALAFPEDARASVDYDGDRLRFEGLWVSDVAANEFVAGEFFKAGVIIRSDDTGGGSIRVQSVLWRNLCLNLIILDRSIGVDVRIRHQGSVQKLAAEFRKAFNRALSSVNPFRVAWTGAMAEQNEAFVRSVQGTTSEDLSSLPPTGVLPGVFNGILERELVPVQGRRKDVIPKLLEMHAQDEAREAYGVSRASVVNAFTRYAHQVETDPFAADLIRAGAGQLLSSRAGRLPAPLPYAAIQL